jgi:nicotinate phosphoribosyltransferase
VDTYDTLESGLWNFIFVALALHEFGYAARGIRLDSGDLAYLSQECRKAFAHVESHEKIKGFAALNIVASNELSEEVLWALKEQKHEVDTFGIGTNLVTCKAQPALGCVYKLVEVKSQPRIKISQDIVKVTIPGRKECYRLFNAKGEPILDLLLSKTGERATGHATDDLLGALTEGGGCAVAAVVYVCCGCVRCAVLRCAWCAVVGSNPPAPQKRILCRHPFDANKRCYVTPSKVAPMHECVWDGRLIKPFPALHQVRTRSVGRQC